MSDIPENAARVLEEIDAAADAQEQSGHEEESYEQIINRLAALSAIEYEQCRIDKANDLGIRLSALDKEVAAKRAENEQSKATIEIVESLEPWGEVIDGAALLTEMGRILSKHVFLKPGQAYALSLWALGTYCMDGWRLFPKVLITSPEKRCGKSTLSEALEGMVYRPLLTSNISPAAIYRCIDCWTPTLLIDEGDTFVKDNDELNGIINSGHTRRTATVIRADKAGDGFEPRKFSTWCAQVITSIGSQRSTLHDRSIHIELTRSLPGQKPAKLPGNYFEVMATIRRKCIRWALDNLDKVQLSTAQVPACGNDRAEDNWWPLFALAEAVGGIWPERVLSAYSIFTKSAADVEESAGHMLIEDISEILDDWKFPYILSRVLVEKLVELEDRPWCEWRRGKPLTQNSLAHLLKPYSVSSTTVRVGHERGKGFYVGRLREAFMPYLSTSGVQTVTT
jgi:putative DNA primase/helicase